MPSPTERQVRDWLVSLGHLVAAGASPDEAADRIRAYVPELIPRYDSSDFTSASREFIGRSSRFFPSYAELCELLDKWPKPSATKALPPPDASHLTPEDWCWVSFWHKRSAELFAAETGFKRGSRDADLANLDSLIRQQSRPAWHHIHGTSEPKHAAPTAATIEAVSRALRPPAAPRSAMPQPSADKPAIRAVPVSDERLREMRRARGVLNA